MSALLLRALISLSPVSLGAQDFEGTPEEALFQVYLGWDYTRILATPGDPAGMSVSVPLGGPAVLEWGQLLLALFVLLVSLCIQVFLSGTSLTIQRRSGYEVDPQPQQVNPFAPEHVSFISSLQLPSFSCFPNRLTVWSKGELRCCPRQAQL